MQLHSCFYQTSYSTLETINMKKIILTFILVVIIAFTVVNYYFIAHFSSSPASINPSPTAIHSQTNLCQSNQLSGTMTTQGAAGNIYAALELKNIGKTACTITLGNTVSAIYHANNIVINYKQHSNLQQLILSPLATVYSQIHYPNGPQCQSGITEKQITFLYHAGLISVAFQPTTQDETLQVPACDSPKEKTTIDIWPLSQNPVTSS